MLISIVAGLLQLNVTSAPPASRIQGRVSVQLARNISNNFRYTCGPGPVALGAGIVRVPADVMGFVWGCPSAVASKWSLTSR